MAFSEMGDENAPILRSGFIGPHVIDAEIRQAITLCWMLLPESDRSVERVKSEIRRIVERALDNLDEDAKRFPNSKG